MCECNRTAEPAAAGGARGETSIVEERSRCTDSRPGQWPLSAIAQPSSKGQASKCARSQPMNAGIDLALARGSRRASPQRSTRARPGSQAPARRDDRARGTCRHPRGARGGATAFSGTLVSASTKQSTRPVLTATPMFQRRLGQRKAPVGRRRHRQGPRRLCQCLSLPSSATMTSKAVSGSQRWSRETPEARATLREWRPRPANQRFLFRAGITKERPLSRLPAVARVSTPSAPVPESTSDKQRASRQYRTLALRTDSQSRGRHFLVEVPARYRSAGYAC